MFSRMSPTDLLEPDGVTSILDCKTTSKVCQSKGANRDYIELVAYTEYRNLYVGKFISYVSKAYSRL